MSQPYKKIRLSSPEMIHNDVAIRNLLADIDFEDDLWPEVDVKENISANKQQKQQQSSGTSAHPSTWRRCIIQSIERSDKFALLLQLADANGGPCVSCRLESPWTMIELQVGELISIKPVWCDSKRMLRVDKDHGYLITLPDHLLSGTTMMGSLFCRRKGALQELFKGMDADNEIVRIDVIRP